MDQEDHQLQEEVDALQRVALEVDVHQLGVQAVDVLLRVALEVDVLQQVDREVDVRQLVALEVDVLQLEALEADDPQQEALEADDPQREDQEVAVEVPLRVGSGMTCASVWTRMCVTCLCLVAWEVDHKAADALQWEALVVGVRLQEAQEVDALPLEVLAVDVHHQEVQAADALHRVAREADVHQLEAQAVAALEVDQWVEVVLEITPGAQVRKDTVYWSVVSQSVSQMVCQTKKVKVSSRKF